MTTIATDGRTIAADGLLTGRGLVWGTSSQKVWRLQSGDLMGFSGTLGDAPSWRRWLDGPDGEMPPACQNPGDVEMMVLRTDGTAYCVDGWGRVNNLDLPSAVGSGAEAAMGAMLAGATPEQAVSIAARLDLHTGGVIRSWSHPPK